ncbi:GMC family oxidoreductase N-terminal domain-containing protein [Streptomyces enissocaesilis]|uniref:GMC family oxidoreductase N-terminal domain-containing protein n=1 Tax=Streptomyces enissocaesilis TaxID=332589 RepID=A0ABP6JNM5_9ACTN
MAGELARRRPSLTVRLVDAGNDREVGALLDRDPRDPTTPGVRTMRRHGGSEDFPVPSGIGGSSLLHAGIALRGTGRDLAMWHARAGHRWSPGALTTLFDRLESGGDKDGRSTDGGKTDNGEGSGPLRHADPDRLPPAYRAFLAYCGRVFGTTGNLNDPASHGVGTVPGVGTAGSIATTARQYLGRDRRPANLQLTGESVVDSVELTAGRVSHAHVRHLPSGHSTRVEAGIVVLAAGAVASAEILLRSGIGSAARLAEVGRASVLDLPGVGAALRDHPVLWCEAAVDPAPGDPPWPWHAVLCRTTPEDPRLPDCSLELFHDFRLRQRDLWRHRVVLSHTQLTDVTPGSVSLVRTGDRLTTRVEAARPARESTTRLHTAHALGLHAESEFRAVGLRRPRLRPHPGAPAPDRAADGVRSAYHFHGTCPMGTDPAVAVTGTDLKVLGTSNLYVADASVIPGQFGANTHHATRAVALRAADEIDGALALH